MLVAGEPLTVHTPTATRAWCALVALSVRRQLRLRQMVVIATALMVLAVVFVGLFTWNVGWGQGRRNYPKWDREQPTQTRVRLSAVSKQYDLVSRGLPLPAEVAAIHRAGAAALAAEIKASSVVGFSRSVALGVFAGFLLPLWTLAFATDAFGSDREARSMLWLLSRPIPRPAVYVAKYVAALPWCLGFNLFGFTAICLAAGDVGRTALKLYWPAVALGTLVYAALFVLFGAAFRLPTVVGLLYCFFLEILLAGMPGRLRQASVAYYVRSLMLDAGAPIGLKPEAPAVELPLDGTLAASVMLAAAAGLVGLGMALFARWEYRDDS